MSSLLTLPRELRDQIYIYTTQQTWSANSTLRIIPPPGSDGELYYWPEHRKWQGIPLLGVCHQTRSELQDLISARHNQSTNKNNPLRMDLDIKIRGFVYTPIITRFNYLLQPRDTLDTLHVNLTILSTEAFTRNDGWPRQPGQIFRTLLNFLNRLIYKGPSFLDFDPPYQTPGPHFIGLLSVHISFKDDYTPGTWAHTVHEVFRMLKALSLLDAAHHRIGKIRATTSYSYRGEHVTRDRTWEVCIPGTATLKAEDWAHSGFAFGDWWLQRQDNHGRLEFWDRLPDFDSN